MYIVLAKCILQKPIAKLVINFAHIGIDLAR